MPAPTPSSLETFSPASSLNVSAATATASTVASKKTGAARQADLVKLVAGFLNPVVD
jgi:hypothetical protein